MNLGFRIERYKWLYLLDWLRVYRGETTWIEIFANKLEERERCLKQELNSLIFGSLK